MTDRDTKAARNLLNRQFRQEKPNFRATDITYIPTSKGFVYLCAVMDLCGRKILARRVGDDMTTTPVAEYMYFYNMR